VELKYKNLDCTPNPMYTFYFLFLKYKIIIRTSKIKQLSESGRPSPLTLTYMCNSTDATYLKNIFLSFASLSENFKYLTGWEEWGRHTETS